MEKDKQLKILELFCGTKSFSKVAEERGHQVYSVDINKKFNPDLCIDVSKLTSELIIELFGKPDVIWASPPCTEYSHAKRVGVRKIKEANAIVGKTLQLIQELEPQFWILENPQTGLLKQQSFMVDLPFTDASYCKYGMPYRKQTRLWNNLDLNLKTCKKDCKFMNGKKHIGSAGNGRKKYTDKSYKLTEKYVVPKELCLTIIKKIEDKLNTTELGIPPKPKVLGILPNFI